MTVGLLIATAAVAFGQTPNFIQPASYPTGGSSKFVAVADFNRDGYPDLATYESATQSLCFMFGMADGTFQAPVSRGLGFSATSIAAADLNGDGFLDLVLSTGGGVAVLLNAGDGSFAAASFYSAGIASNYVTVADVNHDGVMDLVVAGGNGFAILRGLAAGTFSAPLILSGTLSHFWVGVADFNGDGNLDLVGDGSPGQFYAGNGDGTFVPPVTSNTIPYGAVVGDFNGDGKMDVAYLITTFNQERVAGQQVSVLIGTGTGQFLDALDMFFTGTGSGQIAAGDFNGDNRTDLAIWLASAAQLYVLPNASSQLTAIPANLTAAANATLAAAADMDGNGSRDLLLLSPTTATVLRSTHGNPPLLAVATLAPTFLTGGASAQGTVTLGGPAPAGGATVALSSSNPTLAYPAAVAVTIPAGASSASFSISTAGVVSETPVSITGTYNSVPQSALLTLVASYALTGVTVNPSSQFGGFTIQGTVVLSGPADSTATLSLSSSNAAIAYVPASVTVPAGATSATFPITLQPVVADTAVSISAAMGGVNRSAGVTVVRPLDSVAITKAEDAVRSSQLKVEATSTSTTASLTVWNAGTGALIGTLSNAGGGKYTGTLTVSPAVLSITVKSSLGGIATGPVVQK